MKKLKVVSIKEYKEIYGIHITTKHTGKMEDMMSLSTACTINPQCQKNKMIEGSICEHCFAMAMCNQYDNLDQCLIRNSNILFNEIVEAVPFINSTYFRLEAFGDLASPIQVVNYFNICNYNKKCTFALWTKNPHFILEAMNLYGIKKPRNLIIIRSSFFLNRSLTIEKTKEKYPFVDKIFTVYTEDHKNENNTKINCGARHCATCLKCYKKNSIKYINELLK